MATTVIDLAMADLIHGIVDNPVIGLVVGRVGIGLRVGRDVRAGDFIRQQIVVTTATIGKTNRFIGIVIGVVVNRTSCVNR